MKTVPATAQLNKNISFRTLGLFGLCALSLVITVASFARAPFMPRSSSLQPPLSTVNLSGTVFAHLTLKEPVLITEQGLTVLLEGSLDQIIRLDFSSKVNAQSFDLSANTTILSVDLMQEDKAYLSFYAYAGEVRRQDGFLIINALLNNPNGQSLYLNARLELAAEPL